MAVNNCPPTADGASSFKFGGLPWRSSPLTGSGGIPRTSAFTPLCWHEGVEFTASRVFNSAASVLVPAGRATFAVHRVCTPFLPWTAGIRSKFAAGTGSDPGVGGAGPGPGGAGPPAGIPERPRMLLGGFACAGQPRMWSIPTCPPHVIVTLVIGLPGGLHCAIVLPPMQLPLKQAHATFFPL